MKSNHEYTHVVDQLTDARSKLDIRMQKLFWQALEVEDRFRKDYTAAKKEALQRNATPGYITVYVSMSKKAASIEISWKKYIGGRVNNQDSSNQGKKTTRTRHIKKGLSPRYSEAKLQNMCNEWEYPIIKLYENEFGAIREEAKQIGEIKVRINTAKDKLRKLIDRNTENEREENAIINDQSTQR